MSYKSEITLSRHIWRVARHVHSYLASSVDSEECMFYTLRYYRVDATLADTDRSFGLPKLSIFNSERVSFAQYSITSSSLIKPLFYSCFFCTFHYPSRHAEFHLTFWAYQKLPDQRKGDFGEGDSPNLVSSVIWRHDLNSIALFPLYFLFFYRHSLLYSRKLLIHLLWYLNYSHNLPVLYICLHL